MSKTGEKNALGWGKKLSSDWGNVIVIDDALYDDPKPDPDIIILDDGEDPDTEIG